MNIYTTAPSKWHYGALGGGCINLRNLYHINAR